MKHWGNDFRKQLPYPRTDLQTWELGREALKNWCSDLWGEVTARLLVIFVRGQDGAHSPCANSWELESGPSTEVMLVAESGSALAVSHLQSPSSALYWQDLTKATWQKSLWTLAVTCTDPASASQMRVWKERQIRDERLNKQPSSLLHNISVLYTRQAPGFGLWLPA